MTPQTTGQCLLRNFLAMLEATCEQDAHALAPADMRRAAALSRLPQPAQSLLLRLLLRKGPWFRVRCLAYEDVEDVDAATADLVSSGLLTMPRVHPPSPSGVRGGTPPAHRRSCVPHAT